MSRLARTLILGVALAAMNLAGMTAVAHSYPLDPAADHAVTSQQQNPTDAVELFRRGERASQEQPTITDDTRRPPTEGQVGESWRHPVNVPARPAEPSEQPDWLVPAIGVLAAVLVLVAGLVVMTARRAGRRVRAGQAA